VRAANCKRCGRGVRELVDSLLCAPCEREMHEGVVGRLHASTRAGWVDDYLDRQADALLAEVNA